MRKTSMPIMPNAPAAWMIFAAAGVPRALTEIARLRANAPSMMVMAGSGKGGESTLAADAIRELTAGLDGFRERFEGRLAAIEASADVNANRAAAERLGQDADPGLPVDREYSATFASYARTGASDVTASLAAANNTGARSAILAAMSVGDNSSGGYLAPVEWDRTIAKAQRTRSPMRRIARVVSTSVGAYSTVWSSDQWGSGWVGETASRPQTTTATLSPITFPTGEIYAMPAATQRLLDDSLVSIDQWLASSLADEFDRQEGVAFISGNGVNKPMGLLQYVTGGSGDGQHPGGNLDVVASGNASTIPTPDVLMTFKYKLLAPYRQNARWLMNSQTAAAIALMKDGQGNYVWREGLAEDQPTTLLGRPVEIDENMPNIGAGNLPVAFGDFAAGYVINDRIGVRILRDPYSNKPFVMFYATKRVGAGLADPRAIRLLKIAAS